MSNFSQFHSIRYTLTLLIPLAYLYFSKPDQCATTPPSALAPIEGIPCQQQCNAGSFLNIDTKERKYLCSQCPKNTYSNGGGFSVDGYFGEWTSALQAGSDLVKQSNLQLNCYQYYCRFPTHYLLTYRVHLAQQ